MKLATQFSLVCLVVIATTVYAGNPKCLSSDEANFPSKCASKYLGSYCCEDPNLAPALSVSTDSKTSTDNENCECKTIDEICKTSSLQCQLLKSERSHTSLKDLDVKYHIPPSKAELSPTKLFEFIPRRVINFQN